jgi:Arc/MetJ family transcription regulator
MVIRFVQKFLRVSGSSKTINLTLRIITGYKVNTQHTERQEKKITWITSEKKTILQNLRIHVKGWAGGN